MLDTLKQWTQWLAGWFVLGIVSVWLIGISPVGRDNTDAGSWGNTRSGVRPATDALTGCQYLITPNGGITPRLDKSGEQIGCRP